MRQRFPPISVSRPSLQLSTCVNTSLPFLPLSPGLLNRHRNPLHRARKHGIRLPQHPDRHEYPQGIEEHQVQPQIHPVARIKVRRAR